MDENSGSESKSIIDFDDEYCENEVKNEKTLSENKKSNSEENEQNNQIDQIEQSIQNQLPDQGEDNQIIAAQENEEELEKLSEENIIYDPKIRQLNEIDIKNKQAIIDILMQDSLISKKQLKNVDSIKEKNKNKFNYIESKTTKNIGEKLSKKNSYGRVGYQIDPEDGDPQFVKDINIAAYLLKPQIQEENQEIAKLLYDDLAPNPSNKKLLTRKEIGEKVQKTLEKRRKNLEKIEAQMYEEQKSQETFKPNINHRKRDGSKRDLNSFLKDQSDFQKRVEQKRHDMVLKNETKSKEINVGRPEINKISEELAKKRSAGDEPAYLRLYNKRLSSEKLKENEEKIMIMQKEEEKKRKEKENELKKNNPYKHVKSKINILKKSPSQAGGNAFKERELLNKNNNNIKSIYKREKSAANIIRNVNKKIFDYKDLQTNKMLWNKFINNFDEALINLNENNSNSKSELAMGELNEYQYHKLLFNLGMVTYPPESKEKKNEENKLNNEENKEKINKQNEEEQEILIENMLKADEKKLIENSFSLLKLNQEKVKTKDIRNFLIFVLDNQNYDLYQQYKTNHEQDLKNLFPVDKYKKEEIPELILKKQNEELLSNIDKTNKNNNKYFYVSKDKKIIFTLDKSQNIKKDFSMFGLNYRNKRKKGKEEKVLNIIKEQYPFKPTINIKSQKLYQKYKDKIYTAQNDTVTSNSNYQIKKPNNMEYIDRILLLDKKRIAENQKIKEEMQKDEFRECTFKPKINQSYPVMIKERKEEDQNNNKKEGKENKSKSKSKNIIKTEIKFIKKSQSKSKNKFEELYQKGKKVIKSKKDKPKELIELDMQRKECTFQPNIKNLDVNKIPKTNFNNDIYNEKEYKYLYERLRHGRLERMVKESNNDRYGLNNELKQFVKDNKEYNFIQNQTYFEPESPFFYNNSNQIEEETNYNNVNNNKEIQIIQKENLKNVINENSNNENKIEKQEVIQGEENKSDNDNEGDPENKDEIPLLIIDVNIRQGVKKKIFVYEGDTPEELAEKFAKEHNLEVETKNKLQSLIHSHMLRLLTRIEEENQSISDKSQNAHNHKIN